ncbi:ThiF family adenylyltransferase, partial [Acinetobacter baumannii]
TSEDVEAKRSKVQVLSKLIHSLGFGQSVEGHVANLDDADAVRAISCCDVIFGCVDSAEGRNLMNRIAAFYTLPYFDVGVGLVADGE